METIEDFQHILDVSAIVAITDDKGLIKHVNKNFCKISKYSESELIGKDHRVINSGFHEKEFFINLWSTIAKGKVWKGEIKNRAKDGTYYWVDTTIVPFLNDLGKPYKYVALRYDITERKLGEERLKDLLKELSDYKYALDESAIVAITDQKGLIKHVNDNFCKISKYSRNELIGQDHRIINSKYHPKAFIKDLWVTISHGKVWKGELRNKAKDGTIYWVDTTIVPFLNQARKPYQYLAIRSDITERKLAEEALRISKNKAEENAKALENKNKQLVDFCNIVSHNLRAPLVNISMLVDYLESAEDNKDRQEIQEKIKPVINHLMEVFNELVESIQVQQDKDIGLDEIDMQLMLKKVLIGFSFQLAELNAEVQVDIKEAPKIMFPQRYMESILTNLISNSLKYRSPKREPRIYIKTAKKADKIILSVKDNGLGINMDLHEKHIFKIRKTFHKHKDAKGFGLFMTKSQVEAMGGRIWVKSKPDDGSTFYIAIQEDKG